MPSPRANPGQEIFKILDKAGVQPLAWGENGYREISNSKHAITQPADLKGLKLRVVGSPLFLDTFTALGANPTQMSWADAQPAMASKAVDGQENPLSVFQAAKLQSVGQKHVTLWGYMNDPLIFVVNKDVWAELDPRRPRDRAARPPLMRAAKKSPLPAKAWSKPANLWSKSWRPWA